MEKQNKLSIKVRDLEPLKNVTSGRRRHHRHHRLQIGGNEYVYTGTLPSGARTYRYVWTGTDPSGAGKWDY
jgi:hypothetical protein